MKAKRILSLILAICMIVSLMPSIALAATEEGGKTVYNYYFSREAIKASENVSYETYVSAGYNFDSVKTGDPWEFVGLRSVNSHRIASNLFYFQMKIADKGFPNAGFVFKIKVDKPGRYSPQVTYVKRETGPKMDVFIVDTDALASYDLSNTYGIRDAANYVKASSLGTLDAYAEAQIDETTERGELASVKLEEGEYYLMFISNGVNEKTVPTSGTPQYRFDLKQLTLTEEYSFEYVTTRAAIKPELLSDRNILEKEAFFTEYGGVNTSASDDWAFNSYPSSSNVSNYINTSPINISAYNTAGQPFLAMKLDIGGSGRFDVNVHTYGENYGTKATVYMLPVGNISKVTRSDFESLTPIGTIDTEADSNSATDMEYRFVGKTNIASAGDYYIVFDFNSTNTNQQSATVARHCFYLAGIKLTEAAAEDEAEMLVLGVDKTILDIGDSVSLTATATYSLSGERVMTDGITYISSAASVAEVSASGVVTAKTAGEAEITATINGTEISDTVKLTVLTEDLGNAGVVLNYITTTNSMLDQTVYGKPRLDSSGTLRQMSDVDSYDEIDSTKTAPWAYAAFTGASINMGRVNINSNYESKNYGTASQGFLALKLNVPNKGDYNLFADHVYSSFGTAADVYFFSAEGISKITRATFKNLTPVGHFDTRATETTPTSGEQKIAKVNVAKRGDYYIVFDCNSDNPIYQGTTTRHYLYLNGIKLSACAGEYSKLLLSLEGMQEDESMVLGTAKKINAILTDIADMPLDEIDENKLNINFTSNNESVVRIIETGYAEALSCGEATIKAVVTYDDITREADYDVVVTPVGENLLADSNPSFEGDEWVWNWGREDEAPSEPKFMRTMLGIAPTEDNPNNRALGVVFNPNVVAGSRPGDIALKTGKRIKIEPGKIYQLSFKYKLENYKIPEDASDMGMIFNLYAYSSQTSGTAVSTFTRTTSITTEENYIDKYSEWQEVIVAIPAPNNFANAVYVTPRLVFRPTDDDLNKVGFEGIAWFDDFELREVGFGGVELEVLGEMNTGNKTEHTVYAKAYSTTGKLFSLDTECVPGCVTFASKDEYIINNPKKIERAGYGTGTGDFVVSGTAKLGGMNGTTDLTATITLNGVTRSASTSVTASNFDVKLYRIDSAADSVDVGEGNTTRIETVGYLSDGSIADLNSAVWEYKSLTPDIVAVDENGVVTPLRAGIGKVNIAVLNGTVGAETVCEIIVTDNSTFESVELSGPETVGYLRDASLTLSGTMSSGCAADTDSADVVWHINSNPVGGISISDNGIIFGEIVDATAEIYADVKINGTTLTTNTITVSVGELSALDFIIDFGETKETVPTDVKIEVDGWEFNLEQSHSSALNASMRNDGILAQTNGEGRVLAVDVNVPYEGIYNIIFMGQYYITGSEKSDIYIDGVYAGEYEFYKNGANRDATPKKLRTVHLTAGTHTFSFIPRGKSVYSKSKNQYIMQLRFAGVDALPTLETLSVPESVSVAMKKSAKIASYVKLSDGFVYSGQPTKDGGGDPEISIVYSGFDSTVATIAADGTVTPVSSGETEVTVTATFGNESLEKTVKLVILPEGAGVDNTLASVLISANKFVMSTNVDGIELKAKGVNAAGETVDISAAEILWHSSDESVVVVSESGFAAPVSVGVADITLAVKVNGTEFTYVQPISVRDGKVGRTYYTDEMVEAAAENSGRYDWAADIKKSAVKKAEKYLGLEETLWNMVTAENIPRSITVGLEGDPERWLCRYCGENGYDYGWAMNPLTRPWKVQCKLCKRYFPSNDFESLYELGKNKNGIYELELAHERNAALVEKTDGAQNYLRNDLYPELSGFRGNFSEWESVETWGVDDGLGYDTGRVYSNGIAEVHTYISVYNHYGLWYNSGSNPGVLHAAANALAEAYIYTGDAKYGRVGAILIDRIADVYPDYDGNQWAKYTSNEDSSDVGKILGRIWECMLVEDFAIAYDAFFPMYDDPQVVSFLSEKADALKLENDKSTPEKIRSNIESGLLREIGVAAEEGRVNGNFGMHQSAVTTAAVVLDTQPYTNEMIDWVFRNGVGATKNYNPGGNVSERLINNVSRDGQGTESGAGYNSYWVTDLVEVAYTLGRYDGYDGLDFWNHPKYIQMIKSWAPLTLTKRGVPSIGDSGTYADFRVMLNEPELMLTAYAETGDIEIAQHLYNVEMYTKGTIDGLHYDIFTKNPEDIVDEIKKVIDTYGEYDYSKSSMLTGYGFAALRDGKAYENVGTSGVNDTMRDFWIYFGGATSHKHNDMMNLGVEAYGLCLTPDLGYPEATGTDPNRHQWQNNTLSHNAVMVDEEVQLAATEPGKTMHFDAKDTRVKVIDVSAPEVYTTTDEYRRSVVMIDYDDEVSYGIDFFNVRGGNDHLYSFHASSDTVSDYSDNLSFYVQPGGTYASVSVSYGKDPYTNDSSTATKLKYPVGYTWLENVRRADRPGVSDFYVDWEIKDIQKRSRNPQDMDIHLRLTMVNDFNADEVTLATGLPPRKAANLSKISHLEYMLVRRKGNNLNTLFTTVIEPYNKQRYIESIEAVPVSVVSGKPNKNDMVKAVKVTMADGRIDYIVYAQNKNVVYNVADKFEFSGFVGVYSENANGENVYNYLHDGTKLADFEFEKASVTGKIVDFQKELSFNNWIDIEFNEALSANEVSDLADRMINVEFVGLGNAAYIIESAEKTGENTARLSLGGVTLIDSFVDMTNEALGYNYDIAEGRSFEIPLSFEDNRAPVFDAVSDNITTSAGNSVSVKVKATAANGEVTYSARTLPRGAAFDAETGTVTWKPTSSQIGENLFAIVATDEMGRKSTIYFTVTVYGSTTGGGSSGQGSSGAGGSSSDSSETPSTPETPEPPETPDETDTPVGDDAHIVPPSDGFVDLDSHSWAEDAINALAEEGIIKGTSERTYSPAANITRADFALLLVRAFEIESDSTENFADVDATDYFASELAIARNTGIVNGVGDNKYAPRNTIIRQDMMTIVYRALQKLNKLNTEDVVIDVLQYEDYDNVASYARDAVDYLIVNGLVNGKNGFIAPTDYTTRAEVAVLLKRILDYISE